MIYPDDYAARLKPKAGQKWRPSNGTEGEMFMARQCAGCIHDTDHEEDGGCGIQLDTFMFSVDDPEYPSEWQIGTDGQPKCTAFQVKEVER